ncbi:hypothetical protein NUW58_g9403 [Xylaria curta]|uniref:Uncharacterized protein n=1 Tax=Xylaria curta TaxID=42375 RepID=A0ACC1MZ98_9PEZI|nr:hypothetical protein NUW58_g9403 [Xylaria curta]
MARPLTLMINIPPAMDPADSPVPTVPPNARRAVSTSAVETPISARSRSASQSRWDPAMPLPPPPPGPPPSTQSRSQSLNRPNSANPPIVSPAYEASAAWGSYRPGTRASNPGQLG